jgi:hypothetical protein
VNIAEPETFFLIEAKINGNQQQRNILYSFVESSNNHCLNKRQILIAEIEACKRLSKHHSKGEEIFSIKNEIQELHTSFERWY